MSSPVLSGMANAFVPGEDHALPGREREMIARRGRLLGPAYRLFYEEPVHLVRGEGVWLYDPEGEAYLDCYNNVAAVGHAQPDVVAAVARQWAALNTHTRYLHDGILDYAERLLATFPARLDRLMLTCTGSEANDLAYRIAKAHTGGTGVIVTRLAYHGVTDAVSRFSPSLGPDVPLGTHVRTVAAPDPSWCGAAEIGRAFAAEVRAALADLQVAGVRPAMLICDTIFSSDGIFADPPGFLAEAVAVAREAGALFVADEVQPGFGRTGAAMWGFARHRVVPDLVTLGKPMGNGQPIAGVVMRADLAETFGRRTRYFNTFAGNPVSCAAAGAVLDVIARDALMENAREVGSHLMAELRRLAASDDRLGAIRGAGLFVGVDVVEPGPRPKPDAGLASRIVNGLRRRRVLISAAGPNANVLKIRPPLVFARSHADLLLDRLAEILAGTRA